jgi:hypothetical protein
VEISVVPGAIRMLCPAVREPCQSSDKTAVE